MFGLIKVEKANKDNINKILIFITLAIVVIAGSSIAWVLIAGASNNSKEAALEEAPAPTPAPTPTPLIPVYSEEAKERLKNIYQPSKKEIDGEEVEEKIAYLTFDDGPSSSVTPQILEILKREEVKATFFVLGSRA